jgi:uncharacterized protein with HEPN domain
VSRDWRLYWQDVIDCCRKVEAYTAGLDREKFQANGLVYDAVVRNLEIIGEAAKHLPQEVRDLAPLVEWKRMSGMRDILAHAYFGIDNDILWNVIANEVPRLKKLMEEVDIP